MNIYQGYFNDGERYVELNSEPFIFPVEQPNWGYCGHGPHDVAEAIVIHEFQDHSLIESFKEEVIAKLPGRQDWTITSDDLALWREWSR